jgi:transketolase N-terminal domain/subunit
MGQFITHRPVAGFLVLAASAGAAAYGLQSTNTTVAVTHTAVDPLGHSYQYVTQEARSERPNLVAGIGAAAAISLFAAFEAFNHAKTALKTQQRTDSNLPRSVVPLVSFGTGSLGLGLSLR